MDQKETMTDLEIRKRRLIYQGNYRGSYEADLLIGRFVKQHIAVMDERELNELEHIMSLDDTDLTLWLTGAKEIPSELLGIPMFHKMREFAKIIHSKL
ncbi:Succinate dehydrogenase flavin-adding protein [Commensalibacter communis]|uniref:succinate dehydrogenase assembly factor 2 n=1 Tax=Commensalibacter communis TaxID=2972786 RepID=UPI0022FF783C|nr:succinate dehydrogenase assembly factor 2 [Commensalibacter communis]CAI3928801.1 Succinate dehydrogenase flavin-adding protein [Commensalibacter communis]